MTRWLAAAKLADRGRTKPTKLTKPTLRLSDCGGDTTEPPVLSVMSVLSGGYMSKIAAPPTDPAASPLDPEGLPFAACPACGGGLFWKPADLPPEGPGWRCEACNPPPAEGWRHAVAVPMESTHDRPAP
jgi:hypothetical protein